MQCNKCGGNRFTLTRAHSDETPVACEDCGQQMGTLGELKQRVAQEVISRAASRR